MFRVTVNGQQITTGEDKDKPVIASEPKHGEFYACVICGSCDIYLFSSSDLVDSFETSETTDVSGEYIVVYGDNPGFYFGSATVPAGHKVEIYSSFFKKIPIDGWILLQLKRDYVIAVRGDFRYAIYKFDVLEGDVLWTPATRVE